MVGEDGCPKEKKTDRFCNNCGRRLTENAPNWFQCSTVCSRERYEKCHPKEDRDGDD